MDIINTVRIVCNEMSKDLSEGQIKKLEAILYIAMTAEEGVTTALTNVGFNTDIEWLRLFIATKRLAGRAESTLSQYNFELWIARNTIGECFANITTSDVKQYLSSAQLRGLSPVTLNTKRLYLNSFFGFLVDEGFIAVNPVARIEPFFQPKQHKLAYTATDIEKLRNACENPRDRAIIEFFLSTGLRVSEVTQLQISDIDMRNKKLHVIGKGRKEREVYYNEVTEFYLAKYIEWRMEHQHCTIEDLQYQSLFASINAPYTPIQNNGIRVLMKKIGNKAEVENVHPHRFRRTFATNCLNRQMPIEKVKNILGHEKIETTLLYIDDADSLEHTYKMYMS